MGLLSKQAIIGANDIGFEDVEVPEWRDKDGNQTVRVRGLTAKQLDTFQQSLVKGEGANRHAEMTNVRAKLAALCMIDEGGVRVFTDLEVVDLGQKSAAALDRVYNVAQRLSGMGAAAAETVAKNSEPDQIASSPSTSA